MVQGARCHCSSTISAASASLLAPHACLPCRVATTSGCAHVQAQEVEVPDPGRGAHDQELEEPALAGVCHAAIAGCCRPCCVEVIWQRTACVRTRLDLTHPMTCGTPHVCLTADAAQLQLQAPPAHHWHAAAERCAHACMLRRLVVAPLATATPPCVTILAAECQVEYLCCNITARPFPAPPPLPLKDLMELWSLMHFLMPQARQ